MDLSDKENKCVTKKTTVQKATIELTGPTAVIEAWAKDIATGKVLGQIDVQ